MKRIAGGTLLLVVGMALGWLLRGTAVQVVQPRRQAITSADQATQVIAASPLVGTTAGAAPAKFTPTDRVMNLAGLTKRGRTQFFVNAISGHKLDPGFIEMYGLSDAEAASLNASLVAAYTRMTQLALDSATAQTDDENKKLIVHVPPFPIEGGVVHDQVFAAFKATLGPERYEAFNVLSANGVEASFGAFGLNDITYTMNLVPSGAGRKGDSPYEILMKYSAVNGTAGTSGSTLPASMIADYFPVLAHFVPPALMPPKK